MSVTVGLHHSSTYRYDGPVTLGPHLIRLRPAAHTRTPVDSYELIVRPAGHFVNWHQDPFGNFVARVVYPDKVDHLEIEVAIVARLAPLNPFDFFLEESAETYPFAYDDLTRDELAPYLEPREALGPILQEWLAAYGSPSGPTVGVVAALARGVQHTLGYEVRLEHGVQSCERTLERGIGSCRDSAWLLVEILRRMGLAARFVSGYLVQLVPDEDSTEAHGAADGDSTDLHAWAEVYLPGAGWFGLDPTSGMATAEGHIPLACTATPASAAPIVGTSSATEATFEYANTVTRLLDRPGVTHPYTDDQWAAVDGLGNVVDAALDAGGVDLAMAAVPRFAAADLGWGGDESGAPGTGFPQHGCGSWPALVENTERAFAEAAANGLRADRFDLDGRHTGMGGRHLVLDGRAPAQSPFVRRPALLAGMIRYWQRHPSLSYLFAGRFVGPSGSAPRFDERSPDDLDRLEAVLGSGPPTELLHAVSSLGGEFVLHGVGAPGNGSDWNGALGLGAFELAPHPQMLLVESLLVRSLIARFWDHPCDGELIRWGSAIHERWMLPHHIGADARSVAADLQRWGIAFDPSWLDAFVEFRFPRLGTVHCGDVALELRSALEPVGTVEGADGTQITDSSMERLQVRLTGATPGRHGVTCNGRTVVLEATDTPGELVGGVGYRAWPPPSSQVGQAGAETTDTPVVFRLHDESVGAVIGGCTYHVAHPGGRAYGDAPVNATEAEARRVARFEPHRHTEQVQI